MENIADIPPELASVQSPWVMPWMRPGGRPDRPHGLITGCGPTGLFAAAVARTAGAATIIATDVSDYRLGLAKQVGVDHTLNARTEGPTTIAAAILDITGGEGVDASLEMSGHPTALHHAFRSVKNGGRVTLFGIPTGPVTCDLANEVISKASGSTASPADVCSARGIASQDCSKPA